MFDNLKFDKEPLLIIRYLYLSKSYLEILPRFWNEWKAKNKQMALMSSHFFLLTWKASKKGTWDEQIKNQQKKD